MVWSAIFGRKNNAPEPVSVQVPVKSFNESFVEWLDELDWLERAHSGILSAKAFARFRVISDELRLLANSMQSYEVRAEEAYVLEGTVRRHIPEALGLFARLPFEERTAGEKADMMLLSQCENIDRTIRKLNQEMKDRVMKDLDAHTIFVEEQFTQPF